MTTLSFGDRLTNAVVLRDEGSHDAEAKDLLVDLQRERPDDALVNLHCAWAHDKLGLEAEAIPYYRAALEFGLEGQHLKDALLGLGSTYRVLGEYDEALATLTRGVESFPGDRSLQVFRAMALYNNGRAKEACEALLGIIVDTSADPDVLGYKRAIEIYAADLDRTWA